MPLVPGDFEPMGLRRTAWHSLTNGGSGTLRQTAIQNRRAEAEMEDGTRRD
jgi:hypothetical protein